MLNNYLHGVETLELRNSSGQSRNTAAAVLIVIENAATDALEKIERAKNNALSAIETAQDNAIGNINTAGTSVLDEINTAQNQAVLEVQSAVSSALNQIQEILGNNILAGQQDVDRYNGHCNYASNLLYNYSPNVGSNNYTSEQKTYAWTGITGGRCENSNYGRYNGFVLFVGTGDTPPTPDDFKLENAVELGVLTASCIHYANGRTIVSREFFNNKDEDVTIKEIGCYIFANMSPNQPLVMIARKVLPTPVVIPEGQNYTFTYTIDTSQISFAEADD